MRSRIFVLVLFGLSPFGSGRILGAESAVAGHQCPLSAEPASQTAPVPIGEAAFGALAEMRDWLESRPGVDWSRVDLDAMREHLIDMHRLMLDAKVEVEAVPAGFRAEVTGTGRTLDAIRRMVPAHARMTSDEELRAEVAPLEGPSGSGVRVTVTTDDESRVARLRGLGFFGFMVAGNHHRAHHKMMALGSGHP